MHLHKEEKNSRFISETAPGVNVNTKDEMIGAIWHCYCPIHTPYTTPYETGVCSLTCVGVCAAFGRVVGRAVTFHTVPYRSRSLKLGACVGSRQAPLAPDLTRSLAERVELNGHQH